jgi:hypothetical protein
LFSTASFSVEKHFCGDVLVGVSLFTEADKCKMESLKIEIEKITKKSCCKDTIVIVEGQDELIVKSFDELDFEQQLFIASFYYSYVNLFESLPQQIIPHKNYLPPNLIFDRQVLDQVFLI